MDALIILQTLSERSELGCSLKARVCPIQSSLSGRQWFWILLPKQKDLGCRGEPHSCEAKERGKCLHSACQALFLCYATDSMS